LHRDFILNYFGDEKHIAEKKYQWFVNERINTEYDSPLNEVVGSTLLGSEEFLSSIKEKYLSGKKPDKNIPALKVFSEKPSMQQIIELVDTVSWNDVALSRVIKIYLCRQYSGEKLKKIGAYFGLGESGVCHASQRIEKKIHQNLLLNNKVKKIEKKLCLSSVKT